MKKGKLSEDEIKFILSVDSTRAQREVHKLTQANKELTKANEVRRKKMIELETLGRKGLPVYQKLQSAHKETAAEIRRNTDRLEQYKNKIGYVNMSYAQLKREAARLKVQLDNTSRALSPHEWAELEKRLKAVRQRMSEVEVGARQVETGIGASLKQAVRYQLSLQSIMLGFVLAIRKAKDFISEGTRVAGVAQGIDDAFSKIADKDYLANLRAQTRGLLDDTSLKKFTVQAKNLGIPIEHMGKLLSFAQQRAKDTGESVDYLADSIVKGLGRKSVLILDNLGLSSVRISEEFKKTGDFTLAVSKIIDEEMAQSGKSIDTAAEAATRKAAAWRNLQIQVGGYFVSFEEGASKLSNTVATKLSAVFSWLERNWKTVKTGGQLVITTLGAYYAVVLAAVAVEKLHNLTLKTKAALLKTIHVSALRYNLVLAKLTGNTARAAAAQRLLNTRIKGNPYAIGIAALVLVSQALYLYAQRLKKASDERLALARVEKNASERYAEQAGKIDALTRVIENNKLSLQTRREAIEKLKEIMPSYNASLSDEGVLYNHNAAAIQNYLQQLEKQIKMKAAQEELEDAYRKKRLIEKKRAENEAALKKAEEDYQRRKQLIESQGQGLSGSGMRQLAVGMQTGGMVSDLAAARNALEKTTAEMQKQQAVIDALNNEISTSSTEMASGAKQVAEATTSLIKEQEDLLEVAKQMPEATEAEITAKNKKIESIEKEIDRLKQLGRTKKETGGRGKKETVDTNELKRQLADGLISREQYERAVYDLTVSSIEHRLSASKLEASERKQLEGQLLDVRLKHKQKEETEFKEFEKTKLSLLKSSYDTELKLYDESAEALRNALKEKRAAGKISEAELNASLAQIEKEAADHRLTLQRNYQYDLQELEIQTLGLKEKYTEESNARLLAAEKDRADKELATRKELETALMDYKHDAGIATIDDERRLRIAALNAAYEERMALLRREHQETEQLERAHQQALANIEAEYNVNKAAARKSVGIATLTEMIAIEMEGLKKMHQQGLLSEAEYQKARRNMIVSKATEVASMLVSMVSNTVNALKDAELASIDAKYDAEIQAAEGNQEKIAEIEERREREKLEIQKKYADVQFAIKVSEIITSTAAAIMQAYAQLGPIGGSVAAALLAVTGAAQVAVANQERQKVKNARPGGKGGSSSSPTGLPIRVASGREEGGYIDVEREQDGKRFRALHEPRRRGYVDRPTVIVGEGPAGRSREWVASNDALQNPTVAPIIRLLDAAQLSGQIRTIDMSTVIRNRYVGHESGGYIRPVGGAESQSVLTPLVGGGARDERTIRVLEKFIDTLDRTGKEGLRASIVYSELERKRKTKERSEEAARKK
ncbi:SHOCT domain-containing protein [Porphyromonas gingivalis]|uniref:Tail tape measure n=1 Tax=Porphyromonas phage phage018a_AFR5B1 TaxID=3154108 RepID=A0AAT9JCM7_9CAUD|nr:SHOCT domain-containing protein [Porphyromonas gingivalis]SJL33473.1 hypothetical protein PGIN_AFR-5B1_00143 [Porphyromonas gingivalis]